MMGEHAASVGTGRARVRMWGTGGLLVLLAAGGWWGWQLARGSAALAPLSSVDPVVAVDSLARAPAGVRIRVHVANASGMRGRARRATALLRERGFDVVLFDTERGAAELRTTVVVHAGPLEWGERVRRALGTGTVAVERDSTRLVEVRVRLGRDWEPPPQSFRP